MRADRFELDIDTPIAQQLEWLERVRAPCLLTHPASAVALAEAVSAERGRAIGLEVIFGYGELVPDGAHEIVAERFGARFAAHYACTEVGVLALECPETRHYHIAVENAVVEVVDEAGRPVPPGERGRVVVSGLYNYAMPFIRYELGDYAVADAEACPCGRTLPVITRVDGTIRRAFVFEDGTRFWLRGAIVRGMAEFVPFRRYQIVQIDHRRIELRYVPDGSGRIPDVDGLAAFARQRIHPSVEMKLAPMDNLPNDPSGKFHDIFSLVSAPASPPAAP